MKRFAMLVAATAIALGGMSAMTTPADAGKGGKPWQTRICQHHVKVGTFKNMGECMKRVKAGAERYCSWLERIGYFNRPYARWKNKGQCKRWYRLRK